MNHQVSKDLEHLLVPVDELITLPNNPRKGNVASIAASYKKFGQVKPIVAVDNGDGTGTVIAGNHQLAAAKQLGWTHIAALHVPFDHDKAIAFALADNRTSDLGEDNQGLLHDMLMSVVEEMPEFFEELGWDDFEMATIEVTDPGVVPVSTSNDGWSPPVIQLPETEEEIKSVIKQGATAVNSAGAKASVQYTLVFNDAEQQATWYSFLRYLKSDPDLKELPTTSEQVMAFLNRHVSLNQE